MVADTQQSSAHTAHFNSAVYTTREQHQIDRRDKKKVIRPGQLVDKPRWVVDVIYLPGQEEQHDHADCNTQPRMPFSGRQWMYLLDLLS